MVSMETNWQNGQCSWKKKLRERNHKEQNGPCEKVKTLSFLKSHMCLCHYTYDFKR